MGRARGVTLLLVFFHVQDHFDGGDQVNQAHQNSGPDRKLLPGEQTIQKQSPNGEATDQQGNDAAIDEAVLLVMHSVVL